MLLSDDLKTFSKHFWTNNHFTKKAGKNRLDRFWYNQGLSQANFSMFLLPSRLVKLECLTAEFPLCRTPWQQRQQTAAALY